jgi:hypothetical protein
VAPHIIYFFLGQWSLPEGEVKTSVFFFSFKNWQELPNDFLKFEVKISLFSF